jgi:integrase
MANRVLALVPKMFNFAIEHDWLDTNPCQMVKRVAPERQRDRVLSEDEVRAVWKALDVETPMIAGLFRLRVLTAQRGGELHGARWDEIDLKAGVVVRDEAADIRRDGSAQRCEVTLGDDVVCDVEERLPVVAVVR